MSAQKTTKPLWNQENAMEVKETSYITIDGIQTALAKPTLLLHSCCGPCSSAVITRVAPDFQVTIYFYNPNITDEEEYSRRKMCQIQLIEAINQDSDYQYNINFKEGPYDRQRFATATADYSNEPEGGRRCNLCFQIRLEKTAEMALQLGYDYFGTTLSVSPHKDSDAISHIGRRLAQKYGISFLDRNFKKNGGYQESIILSKKYGLYRQNYCGCLSSRQIPNPNDVNK
jgi:epoxyqueuosine reductase